MMKPRECCRNCCLCASAPGSVWGVCLSRGSCVPAVSVTHRSCSDRGVFPSELRGGCLGSFRYSAWPLLGLVFVCWVQGVSEEI